MNGPRLRPLGLGDIFDEGFDLYKRNFVFLLLVTTIAVVPLDICFSLIGPSLMKQVYDLFGVTAGQSDASGLWLLNVLVKLTVYLPLYALTLGPLVIAASDCYLQRETGVWNVLKPWLLRLPGIAFCFLMVGAILDIGLAFCLVGWPIAASLLLFSPQAFLLEKLGPWKAMKRANSLAGGFGGRIFGCLLMLGIVIWLLGLGIKLPLVYVFETALNLGPAAGGIYSGGVPGAGAEAQANVVSLLSAGLTHLLLFPFLVSVLTVLYYDMRIRKEGYDVELLAQELGYPSLATLGSYLPPVPAFNPIRPMVPPPPRKGVRGGPR